MVQASSLSVREAGRVVGRSKSHIFRAIKSGTLSAGRDAAGSYRIDRAELSRVFPMARPDAPDDLLWHVNGAPDAVAIRELQTERERERSQLLDQISDLRRRLDVADEERRRLTMILADRRPDSPSPARRKWWWRR